MKCNAFACDRPSERSLGLMSYCGPHYRVRWLEHRMRPRWFGALLARVAWRFT